MNTKVCVIYIKLTYYKAKFFKCEGFLKLSHFFFFFCGISYEQELTSYQRSMCSKSVGSKNALLNGLNHSASCMAHKTPCSIISSLMLWRISEDLVRSTTGGSGISGAVSWDVD